MAKIKMLFCLNELKLNTFLILDESQHYNVENENEYLFLDLIKIRFNSVFTLILSGY